MQWLQDHTYWTENAMCTSRTRQITNDKNDAKAKMAAKQNSIKILVLYNSDLLHIIIVFEVIVSRWKIKAWRNVYLQMVKLLVCVDSVSTSSSAFMCGGNQAR